ncbi:hypothetical protein [Roseateles sp. BYS87W]|uniref:Beta-barrel porin 2 n=1 Tax=Pelomonas baiyunensis TaxID=3299026 RepID=A0ABW7H3N4_9BURK
MPCPVPWAVALLLAAPAAFAQTDDATPFYAGGSVGVAHVSNVFRQSAATNSDTVVTTGLLAGADQRWGRQRFTVDGALQNNRYSSNSALNNQSYTLRSNLAWQTVGNLSGTLSATSSRALADFNIGGGVDPIFKKNTERNDEYAAMARLGVLTRTTLEAGWTHRERGFSAAEYDRYVYRQNTAQAGVYLTPGGNVKLGLVGRHTRGMYPRYPTGIVLNPDTLHLQVRSERNDFTRDDLDFTTAWSTGGNSSLTTRLSRSRLQNTLDALRDYTRTTGTLSWNWRPTAKVQLGVQYARDTGQESLSRAAEANRVYTSWRINTSYALSGKVNLTASASRNRSQLAADDGRALADAFDRDQTYSLGASWAVTRGLSLGCQFNHASRDSSVPQYVYSASSYGCTGQVLFY